MMGICIPFPAKFPSVTGAGGDRRCEMVDRGRPSSFALPILKALKAVIAGPDDSGKGSEVGIPCFSMPE